MSIVCALHRIYCNFFIPHNYHTEAQIQGLVDKIFGEKQHGDNVLVQHFSDKSIETVSSIQCKIAIVAEQSREFRSANAEEQGLKNAIQTALNYIKNGEAHPSLVRQALGIF